MQTIHLELQLFLSQSKSIQKHLLCSENFHKRGQKTINFYDLFAAKLHFALTLHCVIPGTYSRDGAQLMLSALKITITLDNF